MREIPLTRGMVALIDDEDYERVSQHNWHAVLKGRVQKTWYARTNVTTSRGKQTLVYLHTFVMGRDPEGKSIDHRNGDGLDNRKENLRFATQMQQRRNSRTPVNNTTGFKGVSLDRRSGAYRAIIQTRGGYIGAGYHKTAEEAARAYDRKAREVFGEFARTNFDEENEVTSW